MENLLITNKPVEADKLRSTLFLIANQLKKGTKLRGSMQSVDDGVQFAVLINGSILNVSLKKGGLSC